MPEYDYRCRVCEQVTTVYHAMDAHPLICCEYCGGEVHRKYRPARVNWNGLPPSGGEHHPEVTRHINNIERNRERFEEAHEAHEKRSAT